LDLIVDARPLDPTALAALLAARNQPQLICDRCLDPGRIVVAAMKIFGIDQTFALCSGCFSELPRGHHVA
jgi:hypothetical protein